jgi:hypothetical protein
MPRAEHILSKYVVWHLCNWTDTVKDICPMPINDHGWSHPQSIRIMCLCAFHRHCHTWKYCWNLLLGIHYVTLVPCHDCSQVIQYYNVSRKFCQNSLCRKVCVGRCSVSIVSIQNRLGTEMFGSLGEKKMLILVLVLMSPSLLVCWLRRWDSVFRRFLKLRKATISFVMSVRQSAWNNAAATGRIFVKFDIWVFFEKKICRENSSSVKIWQE